MTYYYMNNPINVTEEAKFIGQALTQYKKLTSGLKEIQERNKKAINKLNPELGKDNMDLFNSSIENLCQETELFMTSVLRKLGYKYTVSDNGPQLLFEYPEMIRPAIEIYSKYNDECEKLIEQNVSQEQIREYYRNNRGRFVGGGFGVKGAVKGALFAGAANAAVGAGYGLLNCIANANTRKQLEKEILAHTKTAIRFVKEMKVVENVTKCCEAVYIEIISNDLDNISFQRCINENNNYNQEPYYSSYKDSNQILMDYIDALEKHPYLPISYKAPFLEYGDHNNELKKIATNFNVDFSKIVQLSLENQIVTAFTNASTEDLIKNIDALYDKYGECISDQLSLEKYWLSYFNLKLNTKSKSSIDNILDVIYDLKKKHSIEIEKITIIFLNKIISEKNNYNSTEKTKNTIYTIIGISDKLELDFDKVNDEIIQTLLLNCINSHSPISKRFVLDYFSMVNEVSKITNKNYSSTYDIILSRYTSSIYEINEENIKSMVECFSILKEKYGIITENYLEQIKNRIIREKDIYANRNVCSLQELYTSRSKLQELSSKYGFNTSTEQNHIEREINILKKKEEKDSIKRRTVYDISGYKNDVFLREKEIVFETVEDAESAGDTIDRLIEIYQQMDFSNYNETLISQKKNIDDLASKTSVGQFLVDKANASYVEIEDKALTFNGKRFNSLEELENEKKYYVNGKRFNTISEAETEKTYYYDNVRYSTPQEAKLVSTEMSIIKEINQTTKNSIERLKQYRKHIFKSKTAWDNIISTENNIINNIKSNKSEHRKKTASNIVYAPFYVILRILHYVFWVLFFVGIIATIALFFINKVFFFIAIPATILSFVLKNVCDVDPPSFKKDKEEPEIHIKGNRVYFDDDALNENMNNTYR